MKTPTPRSRLGGAALVLAFGLSACAGTHGATRGSGAPQADQPTWTAPLAAVLAACSVDELEDFQERVQAALGRQPQGAQEDSPGAARGAFMKLLAQALGLADLPWMRTDAPFYVLGLASEDVRDGVVFLLPVKGAPGRPDPPDPISALGAETRRGDGGHTASYPFADARVFVDRLPHYLAISFAGGLSPARVRQVGRAALGYRPRATFEVHAHVAALTETYGAELTALRRRMDGLVASLAGPDRDPMAAAIVGLDLDLLEAVARQAKTARLDLGFRDNALVVRGALTAKPRTALARLLALFEHPAARPAPVPPGTWFAYTTGVDLRGFPSLRRLARLAVTTMPTTLKLAPARAAALQEALGTAMDALVMQETGASLGTLSTQGDNPLAARSVTRVADAAAAREAAGRLARAVFETTREGLKAGLPGAAPAWLEALDTPEAVLRVVQPQLAGLGVKIDASSTREGGLTVDSLVLGFDWGRLAALVGHAGWLRLAERAVGERIELAMGWAGHRMSLSVGAHARRDVASSAGVETTGAAGSDEALMDGLLGRGGLGVVFRPQPLVHTLAATLSEAGKLDIFAPEDALWLRATGDGTTGWLELGVKWNLVKRLASLED